MAHETCTQSPPSSAATSPGARDPGMGEERIRIAQAIPDQALANLKHYLMFVGTARSGHSVFGAVLDAHPNIIIANELHALTLFEQTGFDQRAVFRIILADAAIRSDSRRWNRTNYDYNLPGSAQGRYERLEVIGDKKAGQSSMFALSHPDVPARLLAALGPMLKLIQVVRNPFDTITAMSHHLRREIGRELIERYFQRLDGALRWKRALPAGQFMTVRHEDLIADKRGTITSLCQFVGQQPTEEYLDRCSAMIYESPNRRRYTVPWSDSDKRLVFDRMNSRPYQQVLAGYDF